jgi:hypothetical protein
MSGGYVYTCASAAKRLTELVRLLGAEGLLQAQPDAGLVHQWVRQCNPCRKGHTAKRCLGWRLLVDRGFLVLGPVGQSGRPTIRVDVSANCSFERATPGRQPEWVAKPLTESTVVVEIFDVGSDTILERHHVDLANRGQQGPTWHFQYGGNPAGGVEELPTSWLQEPRWPMAPLDLTLLIELLVYNFFPEQWRRLNGQGEWLRLVSQAEQLVVSHFAQHMAAHFARAAEQRDRTWLAAQDNAEFDPRPS